jgi:hypothetical protein
MDNKQHDAPPQGYETMLGSGNDQYRGRSPPFGGALQENKRAASFQNQRGSGKKLTQGVLVDSAIRSTASFHG